MSEKSKTQRWTEAIDRALLEQATGDAAALKAALAEVERLTAIIDEMRDNRVEAGTGIRQPDHPLATPPDAVLIVPQTAADVARLRDVQSKGAACKGSNMTHDDYLALRRAYIVDLGEFAALLGGSLSLETRTAIACGEETER